MTLSFYETSKCGRDLLTADITFTTLAIIVLGLRFWSARYSGRKLWWDDLLVTFAFVSDNTYHIIHGLRESTLLEPLPLTSNIGEQVLAVEHGMLGDPKWPGKAHL